MSDTELVEHLGAVRERMSSSDSDIMEVARRDEALASILLLGEDNPQSSRPEFQLYPRPSGCSGHRLQSLVLGLPEQDYLAVWRTNLCSPTWDQLSARQRLRLLLARETPWATVVCLGRKVAKVAEMVTNLTKNHNFRTFDHAELTDVGKRLIFLPHPSGRCREWNEPGAFRRAQGLMRMASPTINWGGQLL